MVELGPVGIGSHPVIQCLAKRHTDSEEFITEGTEANYESEGFELRGGMQPGEKSTNAVNITGVGGTFYLHESSDTNGLNEL